MLMLSRCGCPTVVLLPHCDSVVPLWFCCPTVVLLPHCDSVVPLWFCCPTVVLLPHCGSVPNCGSCCPTVVLLPHCDSVAPLWFCCPTVVLLRGAHTSGCPGTPTLWQLVQPPAIYSVDSPSVLPILRWEGGASCGRPFREVGTGTTVPPPRVGSVYQPTGPEPGATAAGSWRHRDRGTQKLGFYQERSWIGTGTKVLRDRSRITAAHEKDSSGQK
jgi:hypothetical protein